jgi:hypothetical protein
MKFYNHCTEELSEEAKRIIAIKDWHKTYKSQIISRVEDMLEVGNIVKTETGAYSVPFKVQDVESLVTVISDRDE